jgi:YVTN family beta-propeller protein
MCPEPVGENASTLPVSWGFWLARLAVFEPATGCLEDMPGPCETVSHLGFAVLGVFRRTPVARLVGVSRGCQQTVEVRQCSPESDRPTATNTAGPSIPVGKGPVAIAITPDDKTAYVVNTEPGTVTPIATATNTTGRPITTGSGPFPIVITPDGKTAYVANLFSDTVTPIAIAADTAGLPITIRARWW